MRWWRTWSHSLQSFDPGTRGREDVLETGDRGAPGGVCRLMETQHVVLAIDDDEKMLKLLSVNLIAEGFKVMTANGGQKGLELLKECQPSLVFLDLTMPGMDGFETLRRIRETSKVPVIILTARDETSNLARAMEIGADDYITKPFSVRELLARVRSRLRRAP